MCRGIVYLAITHYPELSEMGGDFWSVNIGPVVVELRLGERRIAVAEDCEFDEPLSLRLFLSLVL